MSEQTFQIFIVFKGKTFTFNVSEQTNISIFKKMLAKKFRLPYIKNLELYPQLKSPTPFYLRYSGKRLDDKGFVTISDFNQYYDNYPIVKESSIQLMIIFSSKIWHMIKENIIDKDQFILE